MSAAWIVMPVINCWEYTAQALDDCLAQTGVEPRVLVVNNGSSDEVRARLEERMEFHDSRILVWSHDPPLPSLSASWNRALDFVWAVGGAEALVVNNDVRLHHQTYDILRKTLRSTEALFVTAVGVREPQFNAGAKYDECAGTWDGLLIRDRGGPDFSCFLISRACHEQYRFDEAFIPVYCEDLDYHRRLMLGGDGARIFSVNLPYLHYASRTVNSYTPAQQTAFAAKVGQSRAHYATKWGGPVNEERFFEPFDERAVDFSKTGDVPNPPTTPALQRWVQEGSHAG